MFRALATPKFYRMPAPLAAGGLLLCHLLLPIQVLSLTSCCYLGAYLMKAGHWKAIPPSNPPGASFQTSLYC